MLTRADPGVGMPGPSPASGPPCPAEGCERVLPQRRAAGAFRSIGLSQRSPASRPGEALASGRELNRNWPSNEVGQMPVKTRSSAWPSPVRPSTPPPAASASFNDLVRRADETEETSPSCRGEGRWAADVGPARLRAGRRPSATLMPSGRPRPGANRITADRPAGREESRPFEAAQADLLLLLEHDRLLLLPRSPFKVGWPHGLAANQTEAPVTCCSIALAVDGELSVGGIGHHRVGLAVAVDVAQGGDGHARCRGEMKKSAVQPLCSSSSRSRHRPRPDSQGRETARSRGLRNPDHRRAIALGGRPGTAARDQAFPSTSKPDRSGSSSPPSRIAKSLPPSPSRSTARTCKVA